MAADDDDDGAGGELAFEKGATEEEVEATERARGGEDFERARAESAGGGGETNVEVYCSWASVWASNLAWGGKSDTPPAAAAVGAESSSRGPSCTF